MERTGEMGDPCGMPFSTVFISSWIPSRHIAACRSARNDAVQRTSWRGNPFCLITVRRRLWLTKSKKPLMS
ncbi:hypothetical protein B0H21DRAFT_669902, partial [Amylocystis lapponica]